MAWGYSLHPELRWARVVEVQAERGVAVLSGVGDLWTAEMALEELTAPCPSLHRVVALANERALFWIAAAESLAASELPFPVFAGASVRRGPGLWWLHPRAGTHDAQVIPLAPSGRRLVDHVARHWLDDDGLSCALGERPAALAPLARGEVRRALRHARRAVDGPVIRHMPGAAWAALEAYVSATLLAWGRPADGDVAVALARSAAPPEWTVGLGPQVGVLGHLSQTGARALALERPLRQDGPAAERPALTSWIRARPGLPLMWRTTYLGKVGAVLSDHELAGRQPGVNAALEKNS